MKIVYDPRFEPGGYADDNAAGPGRMEAAMAGLRAGPWELLAPVPATREELLEALETVDMLAVSAGFDSYVHDVGHKLATRDFGTLGALVREASLRLCRGRRFAVLEGGYCLRDLGANVLAFCQGFA